MVNNKCYTDQKAIIRTQVLTKVVSSKNRKLQ